MAKALIEGPYKRQALVPPSPWLDKNPPSAPQFTTASEGDSLRINWTHSNTEDVFRWVVYFQYGQRWNYRVLNRNERSFLIPKNFVPLNGQPVALKSIAMTAVDRVGNESERTLKLEE